MNSFTFIYLYIFIITVIVTCDRRRLFLQKLNNAQLMLSHLDPGEPRETNFSSASNCFFNLIKCSQVATYREPTLSFSSPVHVYKSKRSVLFNQYPQQTRMDFRELPQAPTCLPKYGTPWIASLLQLDLDIV